MKRTTYQVPELRDENDNIIQQGAFGKNTALANATNDGWIDYVANDLEALYNNTMGGTGGEINTETITGKTGTITNLTATTVKAGTVTADALNGPLTGNVTGTADKAIADGNGNNIVNTYVTKSDLSTSVSTTSLTVSSETSVPTANAGNSSKAIANTEFVQGELTNYLPLSGGTMTGVLTNNGSTSIPINIKTTGTDYRDIQIESSDGKHRIASIRASKTSEGRCEITIGASTTSNAAPTGITISRSTTNIYATAPTPDATDNSQKIATTEFVNAKAGNYLPLSGGIMTGAIQYVDNGKVYAIRKPYDGSVDLGWNWNNREGAGLGLRSTDHSSPGTFTLFARDANNTSSLTGTPDGSLTWKDQPLLPVGVVQAFAGTTIPSGWLLCDGSAVSRTTYASLYACIGTTYGAGNGSTTFNLPNLTDKFIQGSATAGTVKSAGLPNITGSFYLRPVDGGQNVTWEANNGAIKATTITDDSSACVGRGSSSGPFMEVSIDASRSSSVYGNSTTVQPPAVTMRYIIKY